MALFKAASLRTCEEVHTADTTGEEGEAIFLLLHYADGANGHFTFTV